MENLPDELIQGIESYIPNPIDIVRFSACCKRFRAVLPGRPLRIRIIGQSHGRALGNETFFVSEVSSPEQQAPLATTAGITTTTTTTAATTKTTGEGRKLNKKTERIVRWDEHLMHRREYYLWAFRNDEYPFYRLYLGRHRRITIDCPPDIRWKDCRFSIGLCPGHPTQTWDVISKTSTCNDAGGGDGGGASSTTRRDERNPNDDDDYNNGIKNRVPWNTPVGIRVGGTNTDIMQPDGCDRRFVSATHDSWHVLSLSLGDEETIRLVKVHDTTSNRTGTATTITTATATTRTSPLSSSIMDIDIDDTTTTERLIVYPIPDICDAGQTMVYSSRSLQVAPLVPTNGCTIVQFNFWTTEGKMHIKALCLPFTLVIPILVEDEICPCRPSAAAAASFYRHHHHYHHHHYHQDDDQVIPLRKLYESNSGRWYSFQLYVATAADQMCGFSQPDLVNRFMEGAEKAHKDHRITYQENNGGGGDDDDDVDGCMDKLVLIECVGGEIDTNAKEYDRHSKNSVWYACLS